MENYAVEVVGQIGKGEFRIRPGKANGTDEQTIAHFLMRKDMLCLSTNRRLLRIGTRGCLWHRFVRRAAPVNAAH